jgi:hypothetical protein
MSFCTAINCMDGRIQDIVARFLRSRFAAQYVDMVTEAGPCRILAECKERHVIGSLLNRVGISLSKHQSRGIAVIGHEDCGGNPVSKELQVDQLGAAVAFLRLHYPETPIIALWVELSGYIEEIEIEP